MGYSEHDVESANTNQKRCEKCEKVGICDMVCIFFMGISIMFIALVIIDLTMKYENTTCNVVNVEIPLECPSKNLDHWSKCKCGKKCSSYNPCINLRVVTEFSDTVYDLKETQDNKNTRCTFYNKRCMKDSSSNYDNKLHYANLTYNDYMNTTIDCYYSNSEDFVFIEIDFLIQYIVLVIACISFISCLLCYICCVRKKDN